MRRPEYDEFGGGRADRIRAGLFANLMTDLDLDPTFGRYLDQARLAKAMRRCAAGPAAGPCTGSPSARSSSASVPWPGDPKAVPEPMNVPGSKRSIHTERHAEGRAGPVRTPAAVDGAAVLPRLRDVLRRPVDRPRARPAHR